MPTKKKKTLRSIRTNKKGVKKKGVTKKKKTPSRKASIRPKVFKPQKLSKPLGNITHYFSEISVAIVKVLSPLAVGDTVRIMGGDTTDFNQKIASLQIDHESIRKAKKGAVVGLKVSQKVREGYRLYKAEKR